MHVRPISRVATWLIIFSVTASFCRHSVGAEDVKNPVDPTAKLKRLTPEGDVWIDSKNKQVVMQGDVCLTKGPLEMFAVTKGTKEHEAVVAINTKAFVVHSALLAVGAQSGNTVKYEPKFMPASGTTIDIWVYWNDDKGEQHKARAQDWVKGREDKTADEISVGVCRQRILCRRSDEEAILHGGGGGFYLRFELSGRDARPSGRKHFGQRRFAVRGLYGKHSAERNESYSSSYSGAG